MTAVPSTSTTYIGTATTQTSKAPTSASAYTWAKYVGEDGVPGNNGYIHIAYADSADGKTGFNTAVGTNKNTWDNILTIQKPIVQIRQNINGL